MAALFFEKIPPSWEKKSYPTLRSLGPWVLDVLQRCSQLADWTGGALPCLAVPCRHVPTIAACPHHSGLLDAPGSSPSRTRLPRSTVLCVDPNWILPDTVHLSVVRPCYQTWRCRR